MAWSLNIFILYLLLIHLNYTIMKITVTKLKSSLLEVSLNSTEMETIKGGRSRPIKRRVKRIITKSSKI